ncbi:MAG: helix-turn-helix transcriptional regulator [Clostridia bacterium]|nr:helix-turn-helix transcriptional regulator [Clostridia bacterium]
MISYAPFWETLKEKGESTYTLIFKHGISSATIDRMKKGGGITTAKLDDLCKILNCRVEDIIEYIDR